MDNVAFFRIDAEQVTEILKFLLWGLGNQVQLSRLSSSHLEVPNNPYDSLGLVVLVPLQPFKWIKQGNWPDLLGRRLESLSWEAKAATVVDTI